MASFIGATLSTLMSVVQKTVGLGKAVYAHTGNTSLASVTSLTRVEPLVVVSKDLRNHEEMPAIMSSLLNTFCGYYLQAVSIMTKVNDVEVVKILGALNPSRDFGELAFENIDTKYTLSREAIVIEKGKTILQETSASIDIDNAKIIREAADLSVGKLLNVEINVSTGDVQELDKTGTKIKSSPTEKIIRIPVNVRLLVNIANNSTITGILGGKTSDTSLSERIHAYKAGQIEGISDLLFCKDMIREYKKRRVSEDSGLLDEIARRTFSNKAVGVLKGNPSIGNSSSIYIITEEVAAELERKQGGKLTNEKVINRIYESTATMMIVVVDREYERVTIYTHGIARPGEYSFREIKNASKGKGPDIGDILKSYNMGMPARF